MNFKDKVKMYLGEEIAEETIEEGLRVAKKSKKLNKLADKIESKLTKKTEKGKINDMQSKMINDIIKKTREAASEYENIENKFKDKDLERKEAKKEIEKLNKKYSDLIQRLKDNRNKKIFGALGIAGAISGVLAGLDAGGVINMTSTSSTTAGSFGDSMEMLKQSTEDLDEYSTIEEINEVLNYIEEAGIENNDEIARQLNHVAFLLTGKADNLKRKGKDKKYKKIKQEIEAIRKAAKRVKGMAEMMESTDPGRDDKKKTNFEEQLSEYIDKKMQEVLGEIDYEKKDQILIQIPAITKDMGEAKSLVDEMIE